MTLGARIRQLTQRHLVVHAIQLHLEDLRHVGPNRCKTCFEADLYYVVERTTDNTPARRA